MYSGARQHDNPRRDGIGLERRIFARRIDRTLHDVDLTCVGGELSECIGISQTVCSTAQTDAPALEYDAARGNCLVGVDFDGCVNIPDERRGCSYAQSERQRGNAPQEAVFHNISAFYDGGLLCESFSRAPGFTEVCRDRSRVCPVDIMARRSIGYCKER